METIKDRLIKFLAHLNIGQGKFEKNCGLSNGTVNNIKGGGITTQKVEKILLTYPSLNIDWLITGRGEMEKQSSGIVPEGNLNLDITMDAKDKVISILLEKIQKLESDNAELRRKSGLEESVGA